MTASSRNKLVLAMAFAAVAIPAHASLSTTVAADGGFNAFPGPDVVNTQTVNDSSTASASASSYFPNTVIIGYDNNYNPVYSSFPISGSASASGRAFEGGVAGSLVSSNSGTASWNGNYQTTQSSIDSSWSDNFNFTGSGSATMHFVFDGSMSATGFGADQQGSVGRSVLDTLLSPNWDNPYGRVNIFADFSTFQNIDRTFVPNGTFHQVVDVTMGFNNNSSTFLLRTTGNTYLSNINYSINLDSVTFSPDTTPGATMVNSSGALQFAAPVPEPESYAMMLAGLGLIGFVARRTKLILATNMTFA